MRSSTTSSAKGFSAYRVNRIRSRGAPTARPATAEHFRGNLDNWDPDSDVTMEYGLILPASPRTSVKPLESAPFPVIPADGQPHYPLAGTWPIRLAAMRTARLAAMLSLRPGSPPPAGRTVGGRGRLWSG